MGGERIIDRVVGALSAVTSSLLLVSNAPDASTWLPGVRTVPDVRPERGSLVALHTALHTAGDSVLVVAWDMPFVSAALLRRIVAEGGDSLATIPEGATGLEPFCASYSPSCLPSLDAALDRGDFGVRAFLDQLSQLAQNAPLAPLAPHTPVRVLPRHVVAEYGDPSRLFFNVNTLDDLAVAERMADESRRGA